VLCSHILGLVKINANGWRYETLGISELLRYQGTTTVDARTDA